MDRNHPSLPFNIQTAWGISSIGRVRALQARGTGIETRILHHFVTIRVALVAQMVERKTLNLVVVGSIPTEGVFTQRGFESPYLLHVVDNVKRSGPMV